MPQRKFRRGLTRALFLLLGIAVVVPGAMFFFNSIDRTPQVVERVIPSVVSIDVYEFDELKGRELENVKEFNSYIEGHRPNYVPEDDELANFKGGGTGSGFVYTESGLVITNNHVINKGNKIYVNMHDGRVFEAELVASDEDIDIAVLQLKDVEPGYKLKAVKWRDSNTVSLGEQIIAIGNPFDLGITVTKGIISATGRSQNGEWDDFIQTDASINSGNSGGPSFDTRGRVLGVNTSIYSKTGGSVGIGFLVPSNLAKFVAEQLIDDGVIHRGWLGVSVSGITQEEAVEKRIPLQGVVVKHVFDESPALLNGMQVGDIILEVDGSIINSGRELAIATTRTAPGEELFLLIYRDGSFLELYVTLSELGG